jgi:ATP-dependent helicase HrpA
MSAELVETSKLYARTCATIQPQWIERAAAHLVERSHSEPRWDAASGSVVATEKISLYGLVVIPARTVPYGPINPRISREIFIHHALVLGDLRIPPHDTPFFRHNLQLIAEVELLEAKIRQKNLLADIATRYAFCDARVPQEVTNAAQFEGWRRRAEQSDPRLLYMNRDDLLRADAPPITPENYPDRLRDVQPAPAMEGMEGAPPDDRKGGELVLPLAYRFEPGEAADGLTLAVPLAALSQVRAERYEWLVPGMLEEKIAALLRELPGALRRNFVPVPTWARSAADHLLSRRVMEEGVSLRQALAEYLAGQTGVEIRAGDFAEEALPPFMRMNFKVLDDAGKVLGVSRDLAQLQRRLAPQAAGTFATIYDRRFNRDHLTAWDFGDLPESITVQRFQMSILAFPALVAAAAPADAGQPGELALRLFPSKPAADTAHRAGVRRLFRIEHRKELKHLAGELPQFGQMALQYYSLGKSEELREDLLTLIVDRALFTDDPVPHDQAAYLALRQKGAARLAQTTERVAALAAAILQHYHELTLLFDQASIALADVREQLAYLMPPHFLLDTPYPWLENFPRYLAGMRSRLQKLHAGGREIAERDLAGMSAIAPWWNRYLERRQRHDALGIQDADLAHFRWLLEEYRIALFAQELGTMMPISERRLEKQWDRTRK